MNKYLLTFLFVTSTFLFSAAQKVTFDPVDWDGADSLTITVDLSGTSLSGNTSDLYLWAWTKRGHGGDVDAVYNGTFGASNSASLMTSLGNNKYKILIFPEDHFNVSKELLQISGIEFLLKTHDGGIATNNLGPFKPLPEDGIETSDNWQADTPTRLWVDVKGTPLEGNSGPLYLWSWYNIGSGDVNAAENGGWNNSNESSKMTQVPGTNTWYLDFIPTIHFGTAAANLIPSTVFGLLKTKYGEPQTNNFGVGKTFFKYQLQEKNASNVILNPSKPAKTESFTLTFHAKGALAGYTGDVFLHSGVVTEGLNSTAWSYSVGDWGSPTSPGKMTRIATDTYEIEIESIKDYYDVPDSVNVFKIMAVFRNADGSIQEKDGTVDFQLPIQLQAGLEIREPKSNFATALVNEPFRITGYNPESSDFELYVNNSLIYTQAGTKRASQLYIPSAVGEYWVKIKSETGLLTFTDSVLVNVCDNTSRAKIASLPAGMKYGINYLEDNTKAILVLHAPTESIQNVHVIGDFNNWKAQCSYLMSYDPAKHTFWIELSGLVVNQEYVFQYLIDGKTRIGDPYTRKVSDPWNDEYIPAATYPNLISYPEAARAKAGETPTIASVLQTNQSQYIWDSTGFVRKPMEQLNIYQLHFRDFTTEGTFLAAAEKLDYLQRLGINAIATLPVSEFEGNDSWGYNPNFYFAVDKAYGTESDFKYFVNECHKRGMAVLGDMVLNHAFGTNPMARMYWDDLNNRPAANNPWFNAEHNFQNPAAHWGYDFNHESTHTQAFVDSVVHYWVTEFKIDGIRFDFTKGFSNTPYPGTCGDDWGTCYDGSRAVILKRMTDQMRLVDNGTPGTQPYVIMEHLELGLEDKELADYGIGLWSGASPNHDYAEIAMGWWPSDMSSSYYKNKGFNDPVWISYMESHDEERIAYKAKSFGNGDIQTSDSLRSQFLQTAAVMNLLLRGPRQIWQFGELGYDYSIDYNGRTGRKPVRWDYFEDTHRQKIYSTYAKLLWLRNNLPGTFFKDIDNYGGTKTDFTSQFKRYHYYSTVGDTAVTIVANTANSVITGNPDFNSGDPLWFDFISGDTLSHTTSMTLQPGQFRVLMNKLPIRKPLFELTHKSHDTLGHDSTSIKVIFKEKILKVDGVLGREILAADLPELFELTDSLNTIVPFIGTILKSEIVLTPLEKLEHGQKALRLKAGMIQNYGGLKYQDSTFLFRIESQPVSIKIDTSYTICQGQTEISTIYSDVVGNPDSYSVLYSAAALTAGFENVENTVHDFSSESLIFTIPEDIAGGTYTGTLTFSNSSSLRDTSFVLTIEVEPNHKLSLISGIGTDQQDVCFGDEIVNIKYNLEGGAEGATVTGLPTGLTSIIDNNELEISGLPTETGLFTYSIITLGNDCKKDTLTGTLTINAPASVALAGNDQVVCPSEDITLDGNLPQSMESGKWTIFSGPSGSSTTIGTFSPDDVTSNAQFTPNRGVGEYFLIWTLNNSSGCNVSGDTVKITVQDTSKPVFLTLPLAIQVSANASGCSATGVDLGASPTASDNCTLSPVLIPTLNGVPVTSSSVFSLGENIVIWKATDEQGNVDSVQQVVQVTNPINLVVPPNVNGVGFVDLTHPDITDGSILPGGTVLSYYSDSLATNSLSNPTSLATSSRYFIKAHLENGCSVLRGVNVVINHNPNCPDHVVKSSPTDDLNSGVVSIKANHTINSSNKISTGVKVYYQSGGSITLSPGTVINSGAVFKAEIKGCDN